MSTAADLDSLSEFVQRIAKSGVSRHALLLRTDRLPKSLARPEQLRSARIALEPMSSAERSMRHDLPGGRMVVSWKGDSAGLIDQTLIGLNRLLEQHPLDAPPLQQIVEFFDLPLQADQLLGAAVAELIVEDAPSTPETESIERASASVQPFEPDELDRLEQNLGSADLSRFARRRPVSRCTGPTAQLAWEERTLSIPELIDTVAPGRDPKSDVWLFRRLTRVLDRRLLSILTDRMQLRGAGPFSITLNVASVLSPEFLRFDAALPAALRNRVVISFLPVDIASDAAAFAFARNFARGRSYRVCLRAVSKALMPALDLPALDLDYIQLIWSPDLADLPKLPDIGRAQWIVGQPCTPEAVAWGLKQGINLFTVKPTV